MIYLNLTQDTISIKKSTAIFLLYFNIYFPNKYSSTNNGMHNYGSEEGKKNMGGGNIR
jgi:hypothetical protein